MKNGKALELLAAEIKQTIESANAYQDLEPYAASLLENLGLAQNVIGTLMPHAMKGDYERFLADATVFMDFFSSIVMGWQWLKISASAAEVIANKVGNQPLAFYESKIQTMKFYYNYHLIKTKGLAKILMNDEKLTIDFSKEMF
jgi:butyryl-CoA dehydrogenase